MLVKGLPSRHTVSCGNNGDWEYPAPNVADVCGFSSIGRMEFQGHYSSDLSIKPPDGTSSYINYREDDGVLDS